MDNINITYRKVKNLKISIANDGAINITSPLGVKESQIYDLIESKKKWIEKHQQRLSKNSKYDYSKYTLEEGSIVYFLGREYKVRLIESKQNVVTESEDAILFYVNPSVIGNQQFKLQLLEEFYRDRADIILNNLMAKYLKITNQEIERVTIKKTKTRWGSCNYVKKTINLNFDLVLRDIEAIEYVILHEIAHLTHPNHSKEFYNYVESYMLDWKSREKRLK
ncbi:SprT family zinc-dependent metalloprotease [Francisella sp. Scap27]|uniref:M48 family metallopeptidase n=1 Tax=Francisella sp. Scap27 TaxID=2589986 RepID=UPI002117BDF9